MKNQSMLITIIVIGIIITLFILKCYGDQLGSSSEERFGTVLGQLGPYKDQLNHCYNQCNRSDPSDRLFAPGNMYCSMYCNSVMTDMANKGIPPEKYPIHNNMTKCERQCDSSTATPNMKRKCISMCHGHNEVADWCKTLWCPYSNLDPETCMKYCTSTWNTNNNQVSWKWGVT